MKFIVAFIGLSIVLCSCNSASKESQKKNAEVVIEKQESVLHHPKNQQLTRDQQIVCAVKAAPKKARENAKVYGYNQNGDLVVLRKGSNEFICIADDPKKDGFQVVAYHTSLEPYMSRGRTLNSEGKSRQEKEEIRSSEAASGVLKMPDNPATLHIYYGKNGYFNTSADTIENAKYRYVVYIPYATQATTGLPLSPNESSHPWLMFPGKYNAHIMISPKN